MNWVPALLEMARQNNDNFTSKPVVELGHRLWRENPPLGKYILDDQYPYSNLEELAHVLHIGWRKLKNEITDSSLDTVENPVSFNIEGHKITFDASEITLDMHVL